MWRAPPLTCVAMDLLSSTIYAQQNNSTAFFRYTVATGVWESLTAAPLFSGNNGGAVLLNGKVYTSYTFNSALLGVYDIATDSWSTIPNPTSGTGVIAGDGVQWLYLAGPSGFLRHDPVSLQTTTLAPPPFVFERWGGLRNFSGVLYGHQGNGGHQDDRPGGAPLFGRPLAGGPAAVVGGMGQER